MGEGSQQSPLLFSLRPPLFKHNLEERSCPMLRGQRRCVDIQYIPHPRRHSAAHLSSLSPLGRTAFSKVSNKWDLPLTQLLIFVPPALTFLPQRGRGYAPSSEIQGGCYSGVSDTLLTSEARSQMLRQFLPGHLGTLPLEMQPPCLREAKAAERTRGGLS